MVRLSRYITPPSGKSLPLGAVISCYYYLDSRNCRRRPSILVTSYLAMPGVREVRVLKVKVI
jgi:hypothetical protein